MTALPRDASSIACFSTIGDRCFPVSFGTMSTWSEATPGCFSSPARCATGWPRPHGERA